MPAGALEWLLNLARLRVTGMPMADTYRFAMLVQRTDPKDPGVAAERLSILFAHRNRLPAYRAKIEAAEANLNHKIAVYSALDRLEETHGAGFHGAWMLGHWGPVDGWRTVEHVQDLAGALSFGALSDGAYAGIEAAIDRPPEGPPGDR